MSVDELCVNSLRFLALDAIEQARSGHPGFPLGAAPMAYVLWDRFLKHNPQNPTWINRDRFILSAGHGSALLYAMLHVYSYNVPLKELKRFRQWGSKTPGHPEYGHTPGVEATTGPLGQGFAMGVGMAMAEKFLEQCFNTPSFPIIDHHTYAIISDGDLMEGISAEAASLAGTLHLNKLIYLYDDNHISIEGETDSTFTENVQHRFEAYNWNVLQVNDGNDLNEIRVAISIAHKEKVKPSLIIVRTHIGYGSPKQDTAAVHGQPLGSEALIATKKTLHWPISPLFYVPREAQQHFNQTAHRGAALESSWRHSLEDYHQDQPDLATQFDQMLKGDLPPNWERKLPVFMPEEGPMATRSASGTIMNSLSETLHTLGGTPHHFFIGGSADLAPSTKTVLVGYGDFGFSAACVHNIHFGVREHAMGAIANGLALHSTFIPYTATFLVFSDYMRPAIRLAALMQTHVIFVFTHDSISIGEDGPTHQPIEQLMSLRAIPNLTVIRPADANETSIAWRVAVERKGPVALVFSRQKLPILDSKQYPIKRGVPRGAYILVESKSEKPDIIMIATGSEVHLALNASKALNVKGITTRVVSMPSWELFEEQPLAYRSHVLPFGTTKIALEAGVTMGWKKYVGDHGSVIGLNRFGASGRGDIVYTNYGFNIGNVQNRVLELLNRNGK